MKRAILSLILIPLSVGAQSSWDQSYLAKDRSFAVEPNGFLVAVAEELPPGSALDVGMGQGRNALFLAEKGWSVTGFDVSPVGVQEAMHAAKRQRLEINATVEPAQTFDWGTERWDLIVLAYFPFTRQMLENIRRSLKPGGIVVLEAYHVDAAKDRPPGPGPGVTYASNELLRVFEDFRVLRYEDVRDLADWGLHETRLVRLAAQKP